MTHVPRGRDYSPAGRFASAPNGSFRIIYADPPWSYRDKKVSGRTRCGAENHYDCMTTGEIAQLPVADLADPDGAVLFLWATFPLIESALSVIPAWGFEYKTVGFTWIKTNADGTPWFGVGAYAKSNSEVCLMATRGRVGRHMRDRRDDTFRVQSNYVSSVVMAPRAGHSEKPSVIRDLIVELFGDVPRIELFARQHVPGWEDWGAEYPAPGEGYGEEGIPTGTTSLPT